MNRAFFVSVAAALLALPLLAAAAAPLPQRQAALAGAEYIRTTQQPDGGFGGFGPGQSMDAILAIRAAGLDPNSFVNGSNTPSDYLRSIAAEADSAGAAAKGALAARAIGLDPRDVAGTDLLAIVEAGYDPATGAYAPDVFTHALALLSLSHLGVSPPSSAVLFLREAQLDDGGWGFDGVSDPDTTAIALQGLIAAGAGTGDPDVAAAVAYFRDTQQSDGGWGYDGVSNTSSTAFAIQALIAAGEDPSSYDQGGVDPVDYLLGAQAADGSFPGFDPAFATNQVVPALAGRTFAGAADTPIEDPPADAPAPPDTGSGLSPDPGSSPAMIMAGILLMAVGLAARAGFNRRVEARRTEG